MRWMIAISIAMAMSAAAHAQSIKPAPKAGIETFPAYPSLAESWRAEHDAPRKARAQRAFVAALDATPPDLANEHWWTLQAQAINAERELGAFDAAVSRIERLRALKPETAQDSWLNAVREQVVSYADKQRVAIARRDTRCADPCGVANLKRSTLADPPPPPGYAFPQALTKPSRRCGVRPWPVISPIELNWYPWHWWSAGEPALYPRAQTRDGRLERTYRFTWLRSFDHPVVVRLTEKGGAVQMTATELSSMGGYAQVGVVERRLVRTLTPTEVNRLNKSLRRAMLLIQPPRGCEQGFDGADWIFEANDHGRYLYLRRWSPKDGPIRDLGTTMLSLTGWSFGDRVY